MSSDELSNQPSREELEERIIALLMGELDDSAAEEIQAAIDGDDGLKTFHSRMQKTLGLVQEAVDAPEISKAPTPLKLSDDRRDELFAKIVLAKPAKQPKNLVELRRERRRKWVSGLAIAAGLAILLALVMPRNVMYDRLGSSPTSGFEGMMAMDTGETKTSVEDAELFFDARTEATPPEPTSTEVRLHQAAPDSPSTGPTVVAAQSAVAQPERMRNIRLQTKPAPPAVDNLSIVLPEPALERDERNARREYLAAIVPPTNGKDRDDLVSRAKNESASRMDPFMERSSQVEFDAEQKLVFEAAPPARGSGLANRDFTLSPRFGRDEIRKAPTFAGVYHPQPGTGGSGPDVSFGTMPPTGDPQPLGEATAKTAPPKPKVAPSFAIAAKPSSSVNRLEDKLGRVEQEGAWNRQTKALDNQDFITSRNAVSGAAVGQKPRLIDRETRFDREAPSNATGGHSEPPPATQGINGGSGGFAGGGGGGLGGMNRSGLEDSRSHFKFRAAPDVASPGKAERLGELTASDTSISLGGSVARGRDRSGPALNPNGPDPTWGVHVEAATGLVQPQGQAGGQGQAAAEFADGFDSARSRRHPSSNRSKAVADLGDRADLKALPELELRERQLGREMAQKRISSSLHEAKEAKEISRLAAADAIDVAKRISADGALAKLPSMVDRVQRGQVRLEQAEAESLKEQLVDLQAQLTPPREQLGGEVKQRLLIEEKRLGGARGGRASVRGLQSSSPVGNDDYGMRPANELRAERQEKEEAAAPAPTSGLATRVRQENDEAGGVEFYGWTGKSKDSAPQSPRGRGWAFQFDADGDGLARNKDNKMTVNELFMKVPAVGDRFGDQVKSSEEADANAIVAGRAFQSGAQRNESARMAQPENQTRRYFRDIQQLGGQKELAKNKQDDKPVDTPMSNSEVLRRLNRNLGIQAPVPTEESLEQSSAELSLLRRDKKKLADPAADSAQQDVNGGLITNGSSVRGVQVAGIVTATPAEIPPPSTPTPLFEQEEAKPATKVRPQQPKTLEPKPEILTKENAFSTFSLNVSDVAFKLAAASLKAGQLPDPETVRSEEFLNALDYHDPAPRGNERLAFAWDRARNPFAHNRDFLRFSIQTAARGRESGQPLNLVVLLDASGSMERADRLAIVRQMLSVLAGQLKPTDRISVVAFARTPWLLVDGMKGGQPKELLDRVINITPQGGTNIEIGLDLAYLIAHRHFLANGNNRVIVLTDGAANLGNVDPEALKAKVEEQRKKNVALDCFGVGWEGYNDDLLETLSRNGDGRYGFINDPAEARDGFANLLAGALQVAAANVKAQIEFNPKRVIAYRQIGYNKHQLKKEQFRDNTVDAAEIGAAESGTAMYSIQVDRNGTGPLATVRVRYKIPATGRYVEEEWELPYDPASKPLENAKASMRLASVAASFAEWMAANPHAGSVSLRDLERYLGGVPEEFSSDERPKQLRTMLQQARRISGE